MEYHRLGGLNNKHIFLTVLEAGRSKTRVLADLMSDESSLSGLQVADFSLCALMAQKEKEQAL